MTLLQTGWLRPSALEETTPSGSGGGDWANIANATDGDADTYAALDFTDTGAGATANYSVLKATIGDAIAAALPAGAYPHRIRLRLTLMQTVADQVIYSTVSLAQNGAPIGDGQEPSGDVPAPASKTQVVWDGTKNGAGTAHTIADRYADWGLHGAWNIGLISASDFQMLVEWYMGGATPSQLRLYDFEVQIDYVAPAMTRGAAGTFEGSRAVARRLTQFEGDDGARVYGLGDSQISTSDSHTDGVNVSLMRGIVSRFRPPSPGWTGLVKTSNSQGDLYAHSSLFGAAEGYVPATYTPGDPLPDSLGTDLIPIPCTLVEWAANVSDGRIVSRQFFLAANMGRYQGGDWTNRDLAMTERIIYLRHAAGTTMKLDGVRPDPSSVEVTADQDMSGATAIVAADLTLPTTGTDVSPGSHLVAKAGVNESTKNLIHICTRAHFPSLKGMEFCWGGIGGASAADHADGSLYSGAALTALFTLLDPNVIWVMVGANGGLGGSKAIYKQDVLDILATADAAKAEGAVVLLTVPWYNGQVDDADIDLMYEAIAEIAADRSDTDEPTLAINLPAICGDMSGLLIDAIHTNREGSQFVAEALWAALDAVASGVDAAAGGSTSLSRRLLKMGVMG